MKKEFIFMLGLLSGPWLTGCSSDAEPIDCLDDVRISKCQPEEPTAHQIIQSRYDNGKLRFTHSYVYPFAGCTAICQGEVILEGNELIITERASGGEDVNCLCPVSFDFTIAKLKAGSTYTLVLQQWISGSTSPKEILRQQITFDKDYQVTFLDKPFVGE